ncbi:cation:proton antiporter domain-containing protein [Demequina rhizosphaerae]|uniref:cation:proton antiporter domain-containing protein n=1 Tax=Demequina rhizosphaerae TaxID=1638985 RepID=UPI0007828A54|nr:cation:proton antiporter [Demequina rhizosphaerae]
MDATSITALALLIAAWAFVSGALSRHNLTGPMLFTLVGFLLGNPWWGPLAIDVETRSAHAVAELALAMLLFADASRIDLRALRRQAAVPLRLLGIGLPLAIALGTVAAFLLGPDMPWALALFIGAALSPTDAALSAPVIEDRRIPLLLRRSLNVESGLNDGIATPVVTVGVVLTASAVGLTSATESVAFATVVRELAVGAGAGVAVGALGGWAATVATRRGWTTPGARRIAVLSLAVGAFGLAQAAGANAFIAAFTAGLAFSAVASKDLVDTEADVVLPELGGELLALGVWFLFGAGLIPVILAYANGWTVLYAVLALTVLRMLPVALALVGAGLPRRHVLFLGWFGPRGLASVVFALIAVEELAESQHPLVAQAIAVVALTVLLSVLLHGATAGPAAARSSAAPEPGDADAPQARRGHLPAADRGASTHP